MSIQTIIKRLENKRILLLGFGKEGQSSYRFIRSRLPNIPLSIANQNRDIDKAIFSNDPYTNLITGAHYLEIIPEYDLVLKSPGVSLKNIISQLDRSKISSQTDLFLQAFAPQCIGVTGTKGKSTTASLLYHVLKHADKSVLMAGNIGIPLFDIMEDISRETMIVMELSSHQLEFIQRSPHVGILLNLFEEHLDHYRDFSAYQQAKYNIARYQSCGDYFIYNTEDPLISTLLETDPIASQRIGFSFYPNPLSISCVRKDHFLLTKDGTEEKICKITDHFPLTGNHNLLNTAAVLAALGCIADINTAQIESAIYLFHGLPHRLELIGEIGGITFYNDSISTIPQASIAAIQALKKVNTIILGGFDRGIDYQPLINFLASSEVEHLIFTGNAGKRMLELSTTLQDKQLFFRDTYPEIVALAKRCTKKGSVCLLSPAAASYDAFRNFEHRGDIFRELVMN
jgi:UDP-N-acetylmuramoylalanine--D-glutamate ligase